MQQQTRNTSTAISDRGRSASCSAVTEKSVVEMNDIDIDNYNKESLGVGKGLMQRADNFQDTRGFMPIISDRVAVRSGRIGRAKIGARIALGIILVGTIVMIFIFLFARGQKSPEATLYGAYNSSVMFLSFEGDISLWREAPFIEAISVEAAVPDYSVLVWEVWGGSVNVYFQFLNLPTEVSVIDAISRLTSAVYSDMNIGRDAVSSSAFRRFGFIIISQLYIDIDVEASKPPVEQSIVEVAIPIEPPKLVTETVIYSPQLVTDGMECGEVVDLSLPEGAAGSYCNDGLEVDPWTSRCRCLPNSLTVCVDRICKPASQQWDDCKMSKQPVSCGIPLLHCKKRCEKTAFCVGVLHDTWRPGNMSCSLIYQTELKLPWSRLQQDNFATVCMLMARDLPEDIIVGEIPHLHFEDLSEPIPITLSAPPKRNKLTVELFAPGVDFYPKKLTFSINDTRIQTFRITANRTITIPNDINNQSNVSVVFAAADPLFAVDSGHHLYQIPIEIILKGAVGEYSNISPKKVILSSGGREWVSMYGKNDVFLGERELFVANLSDSIEGNVTINIISESGVVVSPNTVMFSPNETSSSYYIYPVKAGVYKLLFEAVDDTIDTPPPMRIFVRRQQQKTPQNIAPQSSISWSSLPSNCPAVSCSPMSVIDRDRTLNGSCFISSYDNPIDQYPWFSLSFDRPYALRDIMVFNRIDCCRNRFVNITFIAYRDDVVIFRSPLLNPNDKDRGPVYLRSDFSKLLIVADEVKIFKNLEFLENNIPVPGHGMILTLNILEVELFSYDVASTPAPVVAVVQAPVLPPVFAPQYPPFEPDDDIFLYNVAWVGKTNQSSIAAGCKTCSAAIAINRKVCPTDVLEYTMTESMVPNQDTSPWISIQLPVGMHLHSINIYNRLDCCKSRLRDISVTILFNTFTVWTSTVQNPGNVDGGPSVISVQPVSPMYGNVVVVRKTNTASITNIDMVLSVSEIEILSYTPVDSSFLPSKESVQTTSVTLSMMSIGQNLSTP